MFTKLVAENILKTSLKGECLIRINKNFLAYANQKLIKIKALHHNCQQLQIPIENASFNFSLSTQQSFLEVLTKQRVLTIYQLVISNQNLICKKILEMNGILSFKQAFGGLAVIQQNYIIKYISFASIQVCQPICQTSQNSSFLSVNSQNNGIYINSKNNVNMYEKRKNQKYQFVSNFQTKGQVLCIFKDRYFFQKNNQKVQILDISDKKIIGNFILQGKVKHSSLKQNLLLIVIQNQNSDIYNFFVLNNQLKDNQTVVLNRCIYQKTKSDQFSFINADKKQAISFTESKKKQVRQITDQFPKQVSQQTCSIIYTSVKDKGKIEVLKIDHNRILQSKFFQEKLDFQIQQNVVKNNQNDFNAISQIQKARVETTIQNKNISQNKSSKTVQQIQEEFIEKIVYSKMKIFAKKFNELQKRIQNLEKTIKNVYTKMEESLQNISIMEVQKKVQKLFVDLTPQFQKYFTQVFKQVSGVLQQGAAYYNFQIQKQAEIHKQALTNLIKLSFKATNDIVELSKQEMSYSKKTQEHLKQLATLKKNWTQATEMFEQKMKIMKNDSPDKSNGGINSNDGKKVFVRANLNISDKQR